MLLSPLLVIFAQQVCNRRCGKSFLWCPFLVWAHAPQKVYARTWMLFYTDSERESEGTSGSIELVCWYCVRLCQSSHWDGLGLEETGRNFSGWNRDCHWVCRRWENPSVSVWGMWLTVSLRACLSCWSSEACQDPSSSTLLWEWLCCLPPCLFKGYFSSSSITHLHGSIGMHSTVYEWRHHICD